MFSMVNRIHCHYLSVIIVKLDKDQLLLMDTKGSDYHERIATKATISAIVGISTLAIAALLSLPYNHLAVAQSTNQPAKQPTKPNETAAVGSASQLTKLLGNNTNVLANNSNVGNPKAGNSLTGAGSGGQQEKVTAPTPNSTKQLGSATTNSTKAQTKTNSSSGK